MPFVSTEVADSRYTNLRSGMRSAGLDAVLISGPEYFFFFSNYVLDVRTWERPVLLVVPADGKPFALMHELSTHGVTMATKRGQMWVDDVSFYSEHPRLEHRVPLRLDLAATVADMLRARGLDRARVGYDTPPADHAVLRGLLPDLVTESADELLRPLRWVKTDEELRLVRIAGEMSDFGQERYRAGLAAGRYIQELDAAVVAEISAEACRRLPGEDLFVRLHSECGADSAAPHGGPRTGTRIEAGDGIVNILVTQLNGLIVENERTWFVGSPTTQQQHCFETTCVAQQAAVDAFVAGNKVCDVDAAAAAVFEKAGLGEHILHRTGHGIGIAGHEYPEDMAFCTRELRTGEVYSAEPGIYVGGLGGFRHDDTVIVGDTAPEVVTHTPKDIASQTVPA
ncbi:MAG: M24 family metallopeptidase [Streptosporangiales bacterium]